MMNKADLRKKYKEIRSCVKDDTVSQVFLQSDIFKNAKTVMTYISAKGEPDTFPILKSDKQILVPVTFRRQGIIKPCMFYGSKHLIKGEYGILEPDTVTVYNDDIDVVVVPGICYNKKGYRVGYGGGYYDKFLKDSRSIKVGFCFSQCIIDEDFSLDFDQKVDYIITQERIIKI